jgi:hypothetical protein
MRRLLPILLALPLAAHSQAVAVYGTFSPAHLSNVATGAIYSATGYNEQTASYWSPGFGGGITFNFIPTGPIRVGFDLRGSTKPGTQGEDSALFGVKLGVHPPVLRIKPYGQFSVGYLAARTTNLSTAAGQTTGAVGGTFSNKYGVFEIMGGVDYPLLGPLHVRIVEIGAGKALFSFGGNNPTYFTVNSGLVLHF